MNAFERVRVKEREPGVSARFQLVGDLDIGEFQADAFAGCSALRVPFVQSINTKEHVAQTSCPLMRNRENICREVNRADAPLTRANECVMFGIDTTYVNTFLILGRHPDSVADSVRERLHHRVHVNQPALIHHLPGSVDDEYPLAFLERMVHHLRNDLTAAHESARLTFGIGYEERHGEAGGQAIHPLRERERHVLAARGETVRPLIEAAAENLLVDAGRDLGGAELNLFDVDVLPALELGFSASARTLMERTARIRVARRDLRVATDPDTAWAEEMAADMVLARCQECDDGSICIRGPAQRSPTGSEIFLRIRAIRALLRCTCTRDPKAARRNSARQTLAMSVGRLRDHPVRPRAPARRDGRPEPRSRPSPPGLGFGRFPAPARVSSRLAAASSRLARRSRRPMSPPRSSRRSPTAWRAASRPSTSAPSSPSWASRASSSCARC